MIWRRIGAVIVGIIVAVLIVQIAELIVHYLYPPPPGYNMRDMNDVKKFVATLPLLAMVLVLIGWAIGTVVGRSSLRKSDAVPFRPTSWVDCCWSQESRTRR